MGKSKSFTEGSFEAEDLFIGGYIDDTHSITIRNITLPELTTKEREHWYQFTREFFDKIARTRKEKFGV